MKGRTMRVFWVLLPVLCTGCNEDGTRVPVSGEVTLDGQAVEEGSINFRPAPDTPGVAAGTQITNGRYRFSRTDGPSEGRYIVEVTPGTTRDKEPFGRSRQRESYELDCEVTRDDPQIDILLPPGDADARGK